MGNYTLPFNRCNHSSEALASPDFNAEPKSIEIQGVRHMHKHLFSLLETLVSAEERAQAFIDYISVTFELHHWKLHCSKQVRKALKKSFLRFLRGWMFDSNSIEGAVLKGWVESRFGIPPSYHKTQINNIHSEPYYIFRADWEQGIKLTNAIEAQLDLLYEYVQNEIQRRYNGKKFFRLYRGVYDFKEHRILQHTGRNRYLLRLNNLCSFTNDFERAFEFGTEILEVYVPYCKVFFQADILPGPILKGEEEVIVIGGDYDIAVRLY